MVDKYKSGNSNNIAPISSELTAETAADDLQLPAWELEVESEPEAQQSRQTRRVQPSRINNQVNNSRSRKIPAALLAGLGVLVLGAGAGMRGASHICKNTSSGSFLLAPSFWLLPSGSFLLAPGSWLLAPNSNF